MEQVSLYHEASTRSADKIMVANSIDEGPGGSVRNAHGCRTGATGRLDPRLKLTGSSKPQLLASTSESETVSVVPQLAHLRSTSRVGDSKVENRASMMIKDAEPQLWQAKRFYDVPPQPDGVVVLFVEGDPRDK